MTDANKRDGKMNEEFEQISFKVMNEGTVNGKSNCKLQVEFMINDVGLGGYSTALINVYDCDKELITVVRGPDGSNNSAFEAVLKHVAGCKPIKYIDENETEMNISESSEFTIANSEIIVKFQIRSKDLTMLSTVVSLMIAWDGMNQFDY